MFLLVGVVFISWNLLIQDFEKNYVETGISNVSGVSSNYTDKFDYSDSINDSISPMFIEFQELGDDSKWYEKLIATGLAIPKVIIGLPIAIATVVINSIIGLTLFFNILGIPTEIILACIIGITVYVVFKFVELWRSYPV